ncbi:MAG: hypothetical protein P8X69_13245 [Maritimibacter sp.]
MVFYQSGSLQSRRPPLTVSKQWVKIKLEKIWSVSLLLNADLDALAAYKAHERYQISIARVRPLRELRFAVNFDSSAALTQEAAFD